MYGHIYRTVGVIDGNQGIHVLGHTWSSKKSCEKGLTSVPTLGERFASVLLMLIIQRVQSSTEKEVSCPALVEKRGRAGVSRRLTALSALMAHLPLGAGAPRIRRVSSSCRMSWIFVGSS